MPQRILGTLTIGQAPRPDVVPIIDRYVSAEIRRIHRGVLDGLSRREIDRRYRPEPGEPVLVTRLRDGVEAEVSRRRMKGGVQEALWALEAEGCDAILLLCTGTFDGLECNKAWLIEPDHIIPAVAAGLVEKRQLGVIVPIGSQMGSERGKWRPLHRPPLFAAASPYAAKPDAVVDAGKELQAQGADAIVLDCTGFTERHREALLPLGLPIILSNAVAAKALSELLGA